MPRRRTSRVVLGEGSASDGPCCRRSSGRYSCLLVGPAFDEHADDKEEVVAVVGEWRFLGLGYTTPGDALLAAYEHADHLTALEFLRQEART